MLLQAVSVYTWRTIQWRTISRRRPPSSADQPYVCTGVSGVVVRFCAALANVKWCLFSRRRPCSFKIRGKNYAFRSAVQVSCLKELHMYMYMVKSYDMLRGDVVVTNSDNGLWQRQLGATSKETDTSLVKSHLKASSSIEECMDFG